MNPIKLPLSLRLIQHLEFPHKLGLCERLYGNFLAKHGIRWVATSSGLTWKLDLENSTHRWMVYGKYEGAPFHAWAKRFLLRNGIIVDSGANIGQMLLQLAPYVPDGRVYAYEPSPSACEWLRECLSKNPQLPVEVIRTGLGSSRSDAFLTIPERSAQASISGDGIPIRIERLDASLYDRGVDHVDLWVLDIEGYELQALQGAEGLFRSSSVGAVYVEITDQTRLDVLSFMNSRGYDMYEINSLGQPKVYSNIPEHTNALFLSKRSRR